MNSQEAVDAFAKNIKTTMKANESKTDKATDHEKIVSLNVREINFKSTNLSKEERKPTDVKPETLKSLLKDQKNTASRHDRKNYQIKNNYH